MMSRNIIIQTKIVAGGVKCKAIMKLGELVAVNENDVQ